MVCIYYYSFFHFVDRDFIFIREIFYFLLFPSGGAESIAEKSMSGNSDDKQDTYEDDQGPPIENEPIVNEEWLAFLHMSMQEVLNGETDSLKHQNLVRTHNIPFFFLNK